MTAPRPPGFDGRKRRHLAEELSSRARLWLPDWRPDANRPDAMSALLEIAARLSAEVTQRLDRVPEKCFRGLLHWVGERGKTGQAARMPVTFKMSERAEPLLAAAPVQFQADAGGTPVIFESETPVYLIASRLQSVIGTRTDKNAFYRALQGLDALTPADPAPDQWQLRTPVAFGSTQVQLDPPEGLMAGMVLQDDSSNRYRVETAKDGMVTLSHGVGSVYAGKLSRVTAFSPFDGKERDLQDHALYVGADEALNISTACAIELIGVPGGCRWSYWGKCADEPGSGWKNFEPRSDVPPNVLVKGDGEIEKCEINQVNMRWIRALPLEGKIEQKSASGIKLKIGCKQAATGLLPRLKGPMNLEAVANTTPVVLNRGFHPFGREPRLFDAFHLSCSEAFAKPHAFATINITLGDGFVAPLNSIGDETGRSLVAGIGGDQKLHVAFIDTSNADPDIRRLPPYQPSTPIGRPVALMAQKVGAAISERGACHFSVTDGSEVWLWESDAELHTFLDRGIGETGYRWISCGSPAAASNKTISETCLLRSEDGALKIYVLVDGDVYWQPALGNGSWSPLSTVGDSPPKIARLVPFENVDTSPGTGSDESGLAGLTSDGKLVYCEKPGDAWKEIVDVPATPASYPLALLHGQDRLFYSLGERQQKDGARVTTLEAVSIHDGTTTTVAWPWPARTLIGDGLSFAWRSGQDPVVIFASRDQDKAPEVGVWQPFLATEGYPGSTPVPPLLIDQTPVRIAGGYLLPLKHGAMAASKLADIPSVQVTKTAAPLMSVALLDAMPAGVSDNVLLEFPNRLEGNHFAYGEKVDRIGFELVSWYPRAKDGLPGVIHLLGTRHATSPKTTKEIRLDSTDTSTSVGSVLSISKAGGQDTEPMLVTVKSIAVEARPNGPDVRIAEVDPELTSTSAHSYFNVTGRVDGLAFDIRATTRCKGHFDQPTDHKHVVIEFIPPGSTARLHRLPINIGDDDMIILEDSWLGNKPGTGAKVRFILPPPTGVAVYPSVTRNPELSWEYWNGRGWWRIPGVDDSTEHLVRTGEITFCIPADLQKSEVVGRAGHWIRARLVGGDYGQEKVWLEPAAKEGKQIVIRDTSGIRAPYVVSIDVTYEACSALSPDRILTLDNGSYRDQTQINLTAKASVAIFTPLANALNAAATNGPLSEASRPDCCGTSGHAPQAGRAASLPQTAAVEKAIYLGFTEKLHGSSIALFFLVKETPLDASVPALEVDAFVDGAFRKIEVKDETQALSESGIVTLSCPEPSQKTDYFGQSLHWIRIRPPAGSNVESWNPIIRGVYLNTVWAKAGQTHRQEIVGLSDGSPGQVFSLAHSPVLDGTLELRVREPLGDEERAELSKDAGNVVECIGQWPGPWVRWQPGELATAGSSDRVFDFDASLGIITFGNGRQGAIPPIGNDNIVAVTYRSGGTAAANKVPAWGRLNLITPLRGVEETVTPEGAAGGSDPQDVATALRFASANIAMRDRAITLRDFEQLALQSSPDIVQAKAFRTDRGISIVAVMRGPQCIPSNAVRRELLRHLRDRASPALRIASAVHIDALVPVRLKIHVELMVSDLATAGTIADEVQTRLLALLDPASGGLDKQGWPLGTMVTPTHIAAVITDLPGVEEIAGIIIGRRDGLGTAFGRKHLATMAWGDASTTCRQASMEDA